MKRLQSTIIIGSIFCFLSILMFLQKRSGTENKCMEEKSCEQQKLKSNDNAGADFLHNSFSRLIVSSYRP